MKQLDSARLYTDTELIPQLVEQLDRPLPGREAQRRFAHELSYGRHFGPAPPGARKAAVMALVFLRLGEWRIALTRRPENLVNHSGQVCFPGGVLENGETDEVAAARECEEEVGVAASDVTVLGGLTPLYVFATGFRVRPFVGTCPSDPVWQPSEAEVAEVLEVPLRHLVRPENMAMQTRQDRGVVFDAPVLCWQQHRIWGATAMMLGELIALLAKCESIAQRT